MKRYLKTLSLLSLLLTALIFACSKDDSTPEKIPPEVQNDITPPTISFSIAGSNQQDQTDTGEETDTTGTVVAQQVTIDIAAEDAVGIAKVEAFVDDALAGEDDKAPFKITIDFSEYAAKGIKLNKTQTQHTLTVSATDLAGNVASTQQQVVVDSEMPVISEVSMTNDSLLTGDTNLVTFKASDNEALAKVEAFIDDTPLELTADSLEYSFNINTSVIADGAHTLLITATDQVELSAEYTLNFTSDNTAPVSELKKLSSGSSPEQLREIVLTAEDPEIPVVARYAVLDVQAEDAVGIKEVTAFIDNTLKATDSVSPYELVLNLTEVQAKNSIQHKSDTLYTLKVITTDLAGHQDSISQQVYVDNIKPVISDLNLKNAQGLKGEVNPVYFKVIENHLLDSVYVQLNETQMEISTDSSGYAFNIDTHILEEGLNTLKITARDAAFNQTIQTVEFYVDNTDPVINFTGISPNQTIDTITPLTVEVQNMVTEKDSLKIFLSDSLIHQVTASSRIDLPFDPENYKTGAHYLKIQASDSLGNQATDSIPFSIIRRILKINIEDNTMNQWVSEFVVFVSNAQGEVLGFQEIYPSTRSVSFTTLEDITLEDEYMLTIGGQYNYSNVSWLSTIANLKRGVIPTIQFRAPNIFDTSAFSEIEVINGSGNYQVRGLGRDYEANHSSAYQTLNLNEKTGALQKVIPSDSIYLTYFNNENFDEKYYIMDRATASTSVIDLNDFIRTGFEQHTITGDFPQESASRVWLKVFGYLDATDAQNGADHLIQQKDTYLSSSTPEINYLLNSLLHSYHYELQVGDYRVTGQGLPEEFISYPNWTLDYTYNTTQIDYNIMGSGHFVGGFFFKDEAYEWKFTFNSENSGPVIIPELPAEIQHWAITPYHASGTMNLLHFEAQRFEGIQNYDGVLTKMISKGLNARDVSPKVEIIINNPNDEYLEREPFFLIRD